jgi:hypothetical protein
MIDGQSLMGGHDCGTKLMCKAAGGGVDPVCQMNRVE